MALALNDQTVPEYLDSYLVMKYESQVSLKCKRYLLFRQLLSMCCWH